MTIFNFIAIVAVLLIAVIFVMRTITKKQNSEVEKIV